jgi:hypothetical protein
MRALRYVRTILIGLAAGVLLASPLAAAEHKGERDKKDKKPGMGCPVCRMHMQRMETLGKLKELLTEATGAAEAEDARTTAKKIAHARELLKHQKKMLQAQMKHHKKKMHGEMAGCMGDMKRCMMGERGKGEACEVVNARCPMDGRKLARQRCPKTRTCMFHGRRVGFCCAGCRAKWDQLGEEARWQKFRAACGEGEPKRREGDERERQREGREEREGRKPHEGRQQRHREHQEH